MNCPKCNNKLLTASQIISDFNVYEEPYESGIKEQGKIMQGNFTTAEEITITIMYCENCDKIISTYMET